jgi:type I restriction enzyme, S subunit
MSNKGKAPLVPKLRFPEFRSAEEWEEKSLEEVADVVASGDLNSEFFSPTRTDTHIYPVYSNSVTEEGLYGFYSSSKYKKNSVTVTARGTLGVAFSRSKDFMAIGRLLVFGELKNTDSYFLKELWNYSANVPHENGGIPQLTAVKAKAVKLTIPRQKEQQKITDCLSSLDELIAAQARKVATLKTHKKGLIQQLFPREGETLPRLRFPEFRDAGEWTPKTIGQMGEVITGSTPSTVKPEYYGGDRLFVSPADISDARYIDKTKTSLTEEGFLETRPVKANSILFVCIGSTIGKIAQNRYECATNQQINSVVPNSENSDGFVYYALGGITDKIANIAGKQAVPIVNKSLFSSVELTAPKLPEQKRIANFLSSLDETVLAESQKLETLKTHKKGLMQQLFPPMEEAI